MQKQCSPPTMFQGEILALLSHKNPWGRMEMCLLVLRLNQRWETVWVSDHKLVLSLNLHKLNPYIGFTPIMHDCAIYYTATQSRDLRTYIC